ncbi:MAG TPA: (deoxy)nucleoside triphosphate pyrophosphohydrolase [Candidatus Marinimicrobia bacterium]|nr:(deoxy)nucleoside triphosphate pyrophosphohydrolase [Candidatus Neomarinimicrobiota bacterium]
MTQVSAGLLISDGKLLICQRLSSDPHPLKWEFPGGKVETGETPAEALIRELFEELCIHVTHYKPIHSYNFQYPGTSEIKLHFFQVLSYTGKLKNKNSFQEIKWVQPEDLKSFDFLEGDIPFINRLDELISNFNH